MISPDSELLKGLTNQDEFEAAIKAHVADKTLYGDLATFKKLGPDDRAKIEEILSIFEKSAESQTQPQTGNMP